MRRALSALSLASASLAVVLLACGSDSSGEPTASPDAGTTTGADGGKTPTPTPTPTPPAPTDGGSDSATDAGPLLAPTLDSIHTTDAGVSLGWTNNTPNCDSVDGERKTALESYKVVFSVPGTSTTTVDTTSSAVANPSSTNCTYRLVCKRGGASSPYSFELSTFCMP